MAFAIGITLDRITLEYRCSMKKFNQIKVVHLIDSPQAKVHVVYT